MSNHPGRTRKHTHIINAPGPAAAEPPDKGDADAVVVGAGAIMGLEVVVPVLGPGRVPAAEAVADLCY